MKRHKNLFESVCSYENLFAAARKAWRGKRSRRPAAEFYSRFEEEIVSLRAELLSGTYRHGDYHYFQIHDPKERRKLRKDNVRRFERRLSRMKFEASRGEREWAQVTRSVQSWVAHASHARVTACAVPCSVDDSTGRAGAKTSCRFVSGAAGRLVEQQREQPAFLQPEQQQPRQREQQHRISRSKPPGQAPQGAWPESGE